MAKLTDSEIKHCKPEKGEKWLSDGNYLYLRVRTIVAPVNKRGGRWTKSWVLRYKSPEVANKTNTTKWVLGEWIDDKDHCPMSMVEARRLALEYYSQIKKGIDPKLAKKREKATEEKAKASTLRAIAEEWREINDHGKSERYVTHRWAQLENHLFKYIGDKLITEIRPALVEDVLKNKAELDGGDKYPTVRRVCKSLIKIMAHAVNKDFIEHNCMIDVLDLFKYHKSSNHDAIGYKELPALLTSLREVKVSQVARDLIEFNMHTATRMAESAGATWEEFNDDCTVWTIEADRMKMRKAHKVPLSTQMTALLLRRKENSNGSEFVFPQDSNKTKHVPHATISAAYERACKLGQDTHARHVPHGNRSVAMTTLNEAGCNPKHVSHVLAHVTAKGSDEAYDRATYFEPRKDIMQYWSDHIDRCNEPDAAFSLWVFKSQVIQLKGVA